MKRHAYVIIIIGLLLMLFPLMAGAEIAQSGTCGENATWTLDYSGNLVISGSGDMRDVAFQVSGGDGDDVPGRKIKHVEIQDGITSISNGAFCDCKNLISVSIPNSVISIGSSAFGSCDQLEAVIIPDSVKTIGDYAFTECKLLQSIAISKNVESIGSNPFGKCYSLTELTVDPENAEYYVQNGVLYSKSTKSLICYLSAKEDTEFTIPDGVVSIGMEAFMYCRNLVNVTIPDGLESISQVAFHSCSDLEYITVPQSVTDINDYAFIDCQKLTFKVYEDSAAHLYAFNHNIPFVFIAEPQIVDSGECGNGVTWTLDNEGLLTISGNGYMTSSPWKDNHRYDIVQVYINEGVKNVAERAFSSSSLSRIHFADSVTSIGEQAFSNCNNLTEFVIPDTINRIEYYTFFSCKGLISVTIPESVTYIGNGAFSSCSNLSNITIPEGVTYIGNEAFYSCSNLSSITIPKNVITIDANAFKYCTGLVDVEIQEGVFIIEQDAFSYCSSLQSITIPKSVRELWGGAFRDCYNLQNVSILGYNIFFYRGHVVFPFYNCYELSHVILPCTEHIYDFKENGYENALEIYHDPDYLFQKQLEPTYESSGYRTYWTCNAYGCDCKGRYFSDENCTFEIDAPIVIPSLSELSMLSLPADLKTIETEAFANLACQAVIIPDGCTTIGEKAFANNNNLLYVHVPATVTSIADDAFEGCDNVAVFREGD